MENGVIALGDSFALVPWHVRVNLGTEAYQWDQRSSQQERLSVFGTCHEEHIINSVSCRRDIWGPKYNPIDDY